MRRRLVPLIVGAMGAGLLSVGLVGLVALSAGMIALAAVRHHLSQKTAPVAETVPASADTRDAA